MQTLYALYLQNPFWIWLAVGAVFIALDIASGSGRLVWAALAAAALAFVNLAGVRLGWMVELSLFLTVSVLGVLLTSNLLRRRPRASPDQALKAERKTPPPTPETLAPTSGADRAVRLIGRIGRTTGTFVNGVGRVWIDGAEWGAEIDAGDDALPSDVPVRVLGVSGGVRLRVESLVAS